MIFIIIMCSKSVDILARLCEEDKVCAFRGLSRQESSGCRLPAPICICFSGHVIIFFYCGATRLSLGKLFG